MELLLTVTSHGGSPPDRPASLQVAAGCCTLGRNAGNDLALSDPDRLVSGLHAQIELRPDGVWLTDKSTNGTFINHAPERLAANQPTQLQDGDILGIGPYEISVSLVGKPVGRAVGEDVFGTGPELRCGPGPAGHGRTRAGPGHHGTAWRYTGPTRGTTGAGPRSIRRCPRTGFVPRRTGPGGRGGDGRTPSDPGGACLLQPPGLAAHPGRLRPVGRPAGEPAPGFRAKPKRRVPSRGPHRRACVPGQGFRAARSTGSAGGPDRPAPRISDPGCYRGRNLAGHGSRCRFRSLCAARGLVRAAGILRSARLLGLDGLFRPRHCRGVVVQGLRQGLHQSSSPQRTPSVSRRPRPSPPPKRYPSPPTCRVPQSLNRGYPRFGIRVPRRLDLLVRLAQIRRQLQPPRGSLRHPMCTSRPPLSSRAPVLPRRRRRPRTVHSPDFPPCSPGWAQGTPLRFRTRRRC